MVEILLFEMTSGKTDQPSFTTCSLVLATKLEKQPITFPPPPQLFLKQPEMKSLPLPFVSYFLLGELYVPRPSVWYEGLAEGLGMRLYHMQLMYLTLSWR